MLARCVKLTQVLWIANYPVGCKKLTYFVTMMNNYQCTGCGVVIPADPELTPTVRCGACSTLLNLRSSDSAYMDYQCPGCGATNSADPVSTPEVRCNTCMTLIKLGNAELQQEVQQEPQQEVQQEVQNPPEPSIPKLGTESKIGRPDPRTQGKSDIPELGAAPKGELPQLGGAVKKELPELGSAVKKELPDPDSIAKSDVPELGAAIKDEDSASGTVPEKETVASEIVDPLDSEVEPGSEEMGLEETTISLSDSAASQQEEKDRPAWMKFLLRPRVLIALLGVSPVMIAVIIIVILSFIRCGVGIAAGEGDVVMQGGEIVLGLAALWAMYILGMTFYYADRDGVTDFGHFVMIGGGIWGLYAVATTFPSSLPAIMGHLFFGYVALATIALAVWLLAPYKGIGRPR